MPKPELPEPDAIFLPAAGMVGAPGWSVDGKPRSHPAVAMFPKSGPVRAVADELPGGHKELELEIGRRFAVAMRRDGHQVSDPEPTDATFPDLTIRLDGATVGLELVEVVDARHRQRMQVGGTYCVVLARRLDDISGLLGLVKLQLSDRQYGLPRASSHEGQSTLDELEQLIRQEALELAWCPVVRKLAVDREDHILELIASPEPQSPWAGLGHLTFDMAYWVNPGLLADTIAAKLDRYGKFAERTWLIVWESFPYARPPDEATSQLLESADHGFEQVWFAHVGPDESTSAVQVWSSAS